MQRLSSQWWPPGRCWSSSFTSSKKLCHGFMLLPPGVTYCFSIIAHHFPLIVLIKCFLVDKSCLPKEYTCPSPSHNAKKLNSCCRRRSLISQWHTHLASSCLARPCVCLSALFSKCFRSSTCLFENKRRSRTPCRHRKAQECSCRARSIF